MGGESEQTREEEEENNLPILLVSKPIYPKPSSPHSLQPLNDSSMLSYSYGSLFVEPLESSIINP